MLCCGTIHLRVSESCTIGSFEVKHRLRVIFNIEKGCSELVWSSKTVADGRDGNKYEETA